MKTLNDRVHSWYDSLQEPFRFLITMATIVPLTILIVASVDGIFVWNIIGMVLMLLLIISRRAYLIK